jgi:EpsI family protein
MKALFQSKFLYGLTLVVVIQTVLFRSASHGEAVPLAAPLSAFPANVGGWRMAKQEVIEKEVLDVLKADDTLSRTYAGPEGAAGLFIAFFKTQRQGQSPHSPKNCLPGSGWQQEETGRMDVAIPGEPNGSIHINRYVVSKGEAESMVLYWYQSQGRVIADEFAAKFYLVSDSIRHHRSDTSLVRIVVPITQAGIPRAEKIGVDFVKTFYPAVKAYLPR